MKRAGKVVLSIITCLYASLCFCQNIYKDVTEDSGIDHIYNVYQGLFGGGVSVIDFNNDGLDDLYVTGGESNDKLYKNIGDGRFKDISINAGIRKKNHVITTGVTSADINKDGLVDIFVTTFASDQLNGIIVINDGKIRGVSSNILYINNGDETFTDSTLDYNLQKENFSTSASFGDINADGYPDLFVANYFENFNGNLGNMNHFTINNDYRPELDELYLNINGKYFKNISELLVGCERGYGFGAVFSDIDNDNDLDIYIVNDFGENNQPNQLLINQHPKQGFINKSDKLKMSFGMKAMGIAVGDYNNDQLQDLHISNIFAGPFIVNRGKNKPFINLSSNIGTGFNTLPDDTDSPTAVVGWGTIFIDYDNDADLDLFNSNGPINPPIEFIPNVLFENKGRVFEMKENSGVMDYGIGRGSVSLDYDNDGDLDLFVVNQRPVYDLSSRGVVVKSKLYKNVSKNDNNWLKIKLNGTSSTTRGLGARVKLVIGNLSLIREVDGGSSHASQNSSIVHFGLAKNKMIDSLIVTWPGGKTQYVLNQTPNCLLEIQENTLEEKTFSQKIFDFFSLNY